MFPIFLGYIVDLDICIVVRGNAMAKLTNQLLKKMIMEEIGRLSEDVDHEAAVKTAAAASKLLNALKAFEDSVTPPVKAQADQHLRDLKELLNKVIKSPLDPQFSVAKGMKEPKKVVLKPTNVV